MSEDQFVEAFEMLRERTRDWTEFKPDLLIQDSRIILAVRCTLRLSQKRLAEKLGCAPSWVRFTESGRNHIIHLKPAGRWCWKIEELLKNSEISLVESLEFFRQFKFVRDKQLPVIKERLSSISEMSIGELKERFDKMKGLTNDFSLFDPQILVSDPQSILIFRLVFGLGMRDFAKALHITMIHIKNWENLISRIKFETARKVMLELETLFKRGEPDLTFENIKMNLVLLTRGQGNRSLNSWIKNGLRLAKNQKPTETEKEILDLLNKHKIESELHGIIEGFKRSFCVDFVIPNSRNQKIVMETFDFSLRSKSVSNSKIRIREIDHKFQSIKLRNPLTKTILVIKFTNKEFLNRKLAEDVISSELLNTDHLIINDVSKIVRITKEINSTFSDPSAQSSTFLS